MSRKATKWMRSVGGHKSRRMLRELIAIPQFASTKLSDRTQIRKEPEHLRRELASESAEYSPTEAAISCITMDLLHACVFRRSTVVTNVRQQRCARLLSDEIRTELELDLPTY
jgi:hypothetical protein